MALRLVCIVFGLVALVTPARAQTGPLLRPGDWVRVQTQGGERSSGTLIAIVTDQLRIETGERLPRMVPLSNIARLELSLGRDPARGARRGAMVGAIGGVVAGALTSVLGIPGGTGASFAVIGFPLVTTPAGAILGALILRTGG